MITQEQLEQEILTVVRDYALTDEAKSLFYGQPGTGRIHQCPLRAISNMMMLLYEEIARLKAAGLRPIRAGF